MCAGAGPDWLGAPMRDRGRQRADEYTGSGWIRAVPLHVCRRSDLPSPGSVPLRTSDQAKL